MVSLKSSIVGILVIFLLVQESYASNNVKSFKEKEAFCLGWNSARTQAKDNAKYLRKQLEPILKDGTKETPYSLDTVMLHLLDVIDIRIVPEHLDCSNF